MQCRIYACPSENTREALDAAEAFSKGLFWTPIFSRYRRLPRSRKKVLTHNAALAGYLFCRAEEVDLPYSLIRLGVRPLIINAKEATCSMQELAAFRLALTRRIDQVAGQGKAAAAVVEVPVFAEGTRVQVIGDGLFSGIIGTVAGSQGEDTLVDTQEFWGRLKISSFLLQPASAIA